MSEDAHSTPEPLPQQIAQPLTSEFNNDDREFLLSLHVKCEELD